MQSTMDINAIDVIIRNKKEETFDLILYDTGEISDPEEKAKLIGVKLQSYADYIESNQNDGLPPEAGDWRKRICVITEDNSLRRISSVSPSENPAKIIPVLVYSDQEYADMYKPNKTQKKSWWKFGRK